MISCSRAYASVKGFIIIFFIIFFDTSRVIIFFSFSIFVTVHRSNLGNHVQPNPPHPHPLYQYINYFIFMREKTLKGHFIIFTDCRQLSCVFFFFSNTSAVHGRRRRRRSNDGIGNNKSQVNTKND